MPALMQKAHMAKADLRPSPADQHSWYDAQRILEEVRRLWRLEQALPTADKPSCAGVVGSPAYRALVAEIRSQADRYKQLTGS